MPGMRSVQKAPGGKQFGLMCKEVTFNASWQREYKVPMCSRLEYRMVHVMCCGKLAEETQSNDIEKLRRWRSQATDPRRLRSSKS